MSLNQTRPPRPPWLRALAVTALALAVAGPWVLVEPEPPPVAPDPTGAPPSEAEQLSRALIEARDNCLVAALLARRVPVAPPWFQTVELRRALETDLVRDAAHGELAALREEARWLEGLGPDRGPGARSWADAQLLTAAIHRYLAAARSGPLPSAGRHVPQPIARARLRAFAGLEVEDLLGTWD